MRTMAIVPLHEELKKDLLAIGNEIGHLWQHHDLFWRMIEITNKNERVMKVGGDYLAWLRNSYIEAGSMALRRQLDRDNRSISMINFLREVQKNSASFTRDNFQRKSTFPPGSHFHNAGRWNDARETFDRVFGNGGQLDPAIVQADIDLLEKESAEIREQVNKEIAHKDRRGMKAEKATGDVFQKCISQLDELAIKYSGLLYEKPFDSLRPVYMFDVEEVFTFPWKNSA